MQPLVSEVQIIPVRPKDGLVAFANFVVYRAIGCTSVAIMTRPLGGYRLVYPTKKVGEQAISIFYPISRTIGSAIEEEVIKQYENVTKGNPNARHNNFSNQNRRPEDANDNR